MHCCPNCFSNSFLKRQIRAESILNGTCEYCESLDIEIIDAGSLLDRFTPIFDLYVYDEDGEELSIILLNDWRIFSNLAGTTVVDLLCGIVGNPKPQTEKYKCIIKQDEYRLEQWQAFREELKHENRYFPNLGIDLEHLGLLFELLTMPVELVPPNLYRARINTVNKPYSIEEMGMPPKERVSNGRANPKGISYLYTASDVKTAISEVRPFIDDIVTVARFEVMEPLWFVDLRNPKQTISPFELSEDHLRIIHKDMPFLNILGEELSKPFVPRVTDLEYLPSQYLCEFVKSIGFEGIVYRSSIAEGDNYAIFQEGKLSRKTVSHFEIKGIDVSYSDAR